MNFAYIKYEKPMRERYKALGLTTRGKERKYKAHPELYKLHDHALYVLKWRQKRRKAEGVNKL